MSARMWTTDAKGCSRGMVYLDFSCVLNNTADPVLTYATSFGDTMGNARGEGVASVARASQNVGILLFTLTDGFRGVTNKWADLEDAASGSDDGSYATVGPISNEGLGNSKALTFNVFTRAAGGTKGDYTRRLAIGMGLKDSMEGK